MSGYNVYVSGTLVRSSARFTDVNGNLADPGVIVYKYRKGSGATTTVTYPSAPIIKDGVGLYHADNDTTGWAGPGLQLWTTEWIGTGAVQAIDEDYWNVKPPAL